MNNSYAISLCRKEVFDETGDGIGWGMYLGPVVGGWTF